MSARASGGGRLGSLCQTHVTASVQVVNCAQGGRGSRGDVVLQGAGGGEGLKVGIWEGGLGWPSQ